jgi:hypothetical protein
MSRRVHFVMDPVQIGRIDAAARKLGVSRGEYVRRAVDEALRPAVAPNTRADRQAQLNADKERRRR